MNTILKILLGLMLVVTVGILGYTFSSGGSNEAISLNIVWAYALAGFAVAAALFCAVYGMLLSSGGVLKSLISTILVVGVIGASYYYASSHEMFIVNIENGGFFEAGETVISEASIMVAYVLGAGAVVSALFSELMGAFK